MASLEAAAAETAGCSATSRHDWARLVALAAARAKPELEQHGFAVVDNALGAGAASQLQAEGLALASENDGFVEHTFRFGANAGIVFRKPHIYEADLHDRRLAAAALPGFRALFESAAFASGFSTALPQLQLQGGCGGTAIKIQLNKGNGGCFPLVRVTRFLTPLTKSTHTPFLPRYDGSTTTIQALRTREN